MADSLLMSTQFPIVQLEATSVANNKAILNVPSITFNRVVVWSGHIDASPLWQTGNWTPVWYMAVGQSPLSCWIQAAGAQELLWTGC